MRTLIALTLFTSVLVPLHANAAKEGKSQLSRDKVIAQIHDKQALSRATKSGNRDAIVSALHDRQAASIALRSGAGRDSIIQAIQTTRASGGSLGNMSRMGSAGRYGRSPYR